MNKIKQCIVLTLICLVFFPKCEQDLSSEINPALKEIFQPECSHAEFRQIIVILSNTPSIGDMEDIFRQKLGTNNLTSFLLMRYAGSPLPSAKIYDFKYEINPAEFRVKLDQDFSAVTLDDVRNLDWTENTADNLVQGSFRVETSYGFRALFLFEAKRIQGKIKITRLVIARRNSHDISTEFSVLEKGGKK